MKLALASLIRQAVSGKAEAAAWRHRAQLAKYNA